tara:strand:- start:542 stop:685 length:144 start_codon:yes stop_codon:yes gene_type:complete
MFLLCHIKGKVCAFCGKSKDQMYCGIAKGENKLNYMSRCPYKPRKRR